MSRVSHWWKSCITPEAITHARAIFAPNCPGLRGKTVRVKPERVEIDVVAIPRDFYELNKFVTLVGDVVFVDGLPFILALSNYSRLARLRS